MVCIRNNWGNSAAQHEWTGLHHPCRASGTIYTILLLLFLLLLLLLLIPILTILILHNQFHHKQLHQLDNFHYHDF